MLTSHTWGARTAKTTVHNVYWVYKVHRVYKLYEMYSVYGVHRVHRVYRMHRMCRVYTLTRHLFLASALHEEVRNLVDAGALRWLLFVLLHTLL